MYNTMREMNNFSLLGRENNAGGFTFGDNVCHEDIACRRSKIALPIYF
jgi:hypothetical protein